MAVYNDIVSTTQLIHLPLPPLPNTTAAGFPPKGRSVKASTCTKGQPDSRTERRSVNAAVKVYGEHAVIRSVHKDYTTRFRNLSNR